MSELYPPLANTIVTVGSTPTPAMALWMQQVTSVLGSVGTGSVTHTGNLTAHQVILGNGGVDIKALGALGTSGFVLTSNGAGADPSWQAAAAGTVTHTGTLTNHAVILGTGGVDIKALGSLGTTVSVLHGNATGDPTFGPVSLTADVSGVLALGNGGSGLSSGWVPLRALTSFLSDADIKALPTTPFPLTSAPAAGFRNRLMALSFSTNTNAGAYTNLNATYADLHTTPDYMGYGIIDDATAIPPLTFLSQILGSVLHSVYDVSVPGLVGIVPGAGPYYVQNQIVETNITTDGVAIALVADNNGSGNFTGGNVANSMKVTVYYVVEAL